MALGALGDLVVSLTLSSAQFTDALSKAAYQMNSQMGSMVKSVEQLNAAVTQLDAKLGGFGTNLSGLFGIVAVGGFIELTKSAIDAQAEMGRLAQRAGTTVEAMSGMSLSAKDGGVGLEDVAVSMDRLSKALFEGQDKSTKAAQSLALIGLSAKDLVQLSPDQAMLKVAVALNGFGDSASKTGVEMELLNRSGSKFGAFLKDIAENGIRAASVTDAMAAAARQTEHEFNVLSDSTQTLGFRAANALLPSLNAILAGFEEIRKNSTQYLGFWNALAEALRVTSLSLMTIYTLLRTDINLLQYLMELLSIRVGAGFTASIDLAFDHFKQRAHEATGDLLTFYDQVSKGSTWMAALAGRDAPVPKSINDRSAQYAGDSYYGQGPKRPTIAALPSAAGGTDTTKSIDAFYKSQAAMAKAGSDALAKIELDAIANQQADAQRAYDQGLVAFQAFWDAKAESEKKALAVTETQLSDDVAIQQKLVDQLGGVLDKLDPGKFKTSSDYMNAVYQASAKLFDATGKLITAEEALTIAQQKGAEAAKALEDARVKAAEDYQHQLDGINAELLTIQGNTAAAFKLSFDDSHEDQRKKLTANTASSDPAAAAAARAAKAATDEIERQGVAQAQLSDVTRQYSVIQDQLSNQIARINIDAQMGFTTELDATNKTAAAINAKIGILNNEAAAYQRIADTIGGIQGLEAQNKVEALRIQIAQLGVQADTLNKQFTTTFEDSFASALTSVVTRTKTLSQAFDDMAKSIEKSILDVASKQIAQSLFDKAGPLASLPALLAKAFGGGEPAPAAPSSWVSGQDLPGGADMASAATAATTQAAQVTALTAATTGLTAVAATATAAAQAMALVAAAGGVSIPGGLGGLAGLLPSGAGSITDASGVSGDAMTALWAALPAAAGGTDFAPGGPMLVGERGQEVVNLPRGAQVVPNDVLRGGGGKQTIHHHTNNVTINVPQSTSGATANQIALQAATAIGRAQARFR